MEEAFKKFMDMVICEKDTVPLLKAAFEAGYKHGALDESLKRYEVGRSVE